MHSEALVIFWCSQPHPILKAPRAPVKLDNIQKNGVARFNLLFPVISKGLSLSITPPITNLLLPYFSVQSALATKGPVNCPLVYVSEYTLHQIGATSIFPCLIDVKANVTNKLLDY